MTLCNSLDGKCNVVLVEKKDCHTHAISTLRSFVTGVNNSTIPYNNLFKKKGIVIQGT